jgi:hypothetical protein
LFPGETLLSSFYWIGSQADLELCLDQAGCSVDSRGYYQLRFRPGSPLKTLALLGSTDMLIVNADVLIDVGDTEQPLLPVLLARRGPTRPAVCEVGEDD